MTDLNPRRTAMKRSGTADASIAAAKAKTLHDYHEQALRTNQDRQKKAEKANLLAASLGAKNQMP
jgi:hypothetical protein